MNPASDPLFARPWPAFGRAALTAASFPLFLLAVVGSCKEPVGPQPVARVVLSRDSLSLRSGETATITATLMDSAGQELQGRTVTWLAGPDTVVGVSPEGLVEAFWHSDNSGRTA